MPRKLTNEEFLQKLKDLGRDDIEPLEEYNGMHEKIKWKCRDLQCQFEWEARPADIYYNKQGCPHCAKNRVAFKNRLKNNDFLEKYKNAINENVIILNEYTKMSDLAECVCKNKGHYFTALFSNLIKGTNCPYCVGLKPETDNNLGVKHPNLVKYFKNQQDAFENLPYSRKKVILVCPNCGTEKISCCADLTNNGMTCPVCGDGVSFPNKFVRIVFKKMNVKFYSEWSSDWCKKFKYDIMIEPNLLLEIDGEQHYNNKKSWRTNVEQDKIDTEKTKLAEENGYVLIRIKADKSDGKYIFENLTSNVFLRQIFDFSKIDYLECEKEAQKSLLVVVCQYYNKEKKNIKEIAEEFKLSRSTVSKYLSKGKQLGICNYQKKKKEIKIKMIKDDKEYEFSSIQKTLDFLSENKIYTTFRTIKKLLQTKEKWNGMNFEEIQ